MYPRVFSFFVSCSSYDHEDHMSRSLCFSIVCFISRSKQHRRYVASALSVLTYCCHTRNPRTRLWTLTAVLRAWAKRRCITFVRQFFWPTTAAEWSNWKWNMNACRLQSICNAIAPWLNLWKALVAWLWRQTLCNFVTAPTAVLAETLALHKQTECCL